MEKKPGVYRLQNIVTGKFYIGSSKNLYRRYYSHFDVLKNGCKNSRGQTPNIRIKEDLEKYGISSFVYGIVEYCSKEQMIDREQHYFELWKPEYNVWKNVYNASGRTYTNEQLAYFKTMPHGPKDMHKHSNSLKEAWKRRKASMSPEELSIKQGNSRRGIKHSEETKQKMRETRKGKLKPESMKEKTRQRRLGTKLVNGKYIKV